jgi:hypothetical protein
LSLSTAIPLEVVPDEAQGNENNRSDVSRWMFLVPDALINCPPTTHRSNNTERDEDYENLSVTVDYVVIHETKEKNKLSHCTK